VQVVPIQPQSKPPGTKGLKLKFDDLLYNFAFKFNLHRYTKEVVLAPTPLGVRTTRRFIIMNKGQGLTFVHF